MTDLTFIWEGTGVIHAVYWGQVLTLELEGVEDVGDEERRQQEADGAHHLRHPRGQA